MATSWIFKKFFLIFHEKEYAVLKSCDQMNKPEVMCQNYNSYHAGKFCVEVVCMSVCMTNLSAQ